MVARLAAGGSYLTALIRFNRITIMTDRNIQRTNPFSGQSEMLTAEESKIYDKVKQDEIDENYTDMQKGIDKFSRLNPKAYMTLLD